MHDLEVVPIGECSDLATVTRKNLRPDGSLAWQRRQSHNVVRFAESWRILSGDISPERRAGSVTSASGPNTDLASRLRDVRFTPRLCCKSRFAEDVKNSEGRRRDFRVEI